MNDWAIEAVNVNKSFDGIEAVQSFNVQVAPGNVYGLIGPNGAGKTTLLRLLAGSFKPTSGECKLLGYPSSDISGKARTRVGYVSDGGELPSRMQVEEILSFCEQIYPKWDIERCRKLLNAFALPLNRKIGRLSDGMRTKLSLIIAFSLRPKVLLMDEPTRSMDPVMKQFFYQLVLDEVAAEGTAVMFSTHQLHDLERLSDQVVIMKGGKKLLDRSNDTLKEKMKKIRVIFPEGMPESIASSPFVEKVQAQGRVSTLWVGEHAEEMLAFLRTFQPEYLDTSDMGLEEICLHTLEKEGYAYEGYFSDQSSLP